MSAITAKASRKMKKYAVLTREPRCFLGSLDFSWEQRKFSDITFPAGEKNRDNLPLESYSITNEHGFVPQDEKFENGGTMREADKRMYYIVSPNSFAYNPARINVGSIGYQNIGKNVIVSSLYEVFKTSEDVDDRLLWHWFKSPDFQKLIMQLQEGGVRLYFYYDKLCMGEVSLPSLEEQRKIGKLFDTLDNLITLHQRECISFTGRAGRLILTANKKRTTSSWEQRKLGEIGSVSMCRRIFKEQTSETGDIPFYKIGTFGAEPDAFISRELFEEYKSKYPYPKKGDILISASGSIGRTVEFAGNNEYFQDSNIVWLSHDERLSNSFLKCFYSVVKWAGIEGSTIKRLYNDNILNTVICMPSVPEQEHIGLFFENLDNLITLHQRKFEKLTNVKKSMLEKMFPQNGSSYPEIRFKGFTDPWEQRKFSDVVATRRGLTYKPSDIRKNGVRVLRSSNIAEDSFVLSDEDVFVVREAVNIDCVRANDILITAANGSSRLVGKHTIISGIPEESAVHGGFMLLGTTKEPHFVNASMGSSWYRRFIELFVAGGNGAIGNLNKNDLDNQDIAIPSEKEQKKIGSFFRQLDNLITLHQRELEKLQNIKKSMLEKMFV